MKTLGFKLTLTLTSFFFLLHNFYLSAQEAHTDSILSPIFDTRQALINNSGESPDRFIFLAFWDFDGTILKGDCSEGMRSGDRWIYKGLAQDAIENGYSDIYKGEEGFERFWIDYKNLEQNIGKWLAYPFIPQMLRGANMKEIQELCHVHFETVLKNYYFVSSLYMLKKLEENNIRNYIISASADVFVDASAPTLGLSPNRFHGIEVKIKNDRLSEELNYPVTWSDGKTDKLISIIEDTSRKNPGKQVIALAAFGNSYSTDGPFMKYVAEQLLPSGKAVSVMINGGKVPSEYADIFIQVEQSEIRINEASE